MFRHGHYTDACMLFFPPNAIPPPSQPSALGAVVSSSSPQRPDPLATDYGTVDDLCDLCIGYGAMTVLEEVLSARMGSVKQDDVVVHQHTAAALTRICSYCETHKHFNYLYQFQVCVHFFLIFFFKTLCHRKWMSYLSLKDYYLCIKCVCFSLEDILTYVRSVGFDFQPDIVLVVIVCLLFMFTIRYVFTFSFFGFAFRIAWNSM